MKVIEHILAALEASPNVDQEHVRLARKQHLADTKPAKAPKATVKKSTAKKKSAGSVPPTPPAATK